jgi:transcription elongation factor GreB
MSKAFVKENDTAPDDDGAEDEPPGLPPGVKNYVTLAGLQALRDELNHLARVERPKVVEVVSWAAGNGDRSENGDYIYGKKRLREIDRRMRYLTKRIEGAVPVDPKLQKNREQVFFGAWVTYADAKDAEHTVRIVGIDEANLDQGKVSFLAPLAKALMKAGVGDVVTLRTPAGEDKIEVVEIRYGD